MARRKGVLIVSFLALIVVPSLQAIGEFDVCHSMYCEMTASQDQSECITDLRGIRGRAFDCDARRDCLWYGGEPWNVGCEAYCILTYCYDV